MSRKRAPDVDAEKEHEPARPHDASLGFAPHSGWAALVAVGRADPLRILGRERVLLSDPQDPESKQPYHAVQGLSVGEAAPRLQAWAAAAERRAAEAIAAIVDRLVADGFHVVGVGVLESGGRKGSDLAAILGSHPLIHTADGDHFRTALAAAAAARGLPIARVPARTLQTEAASFLGLPPRELQERVRPLGRQVGPPWGADQKAAALLAWLVLARHGTPAPGMPSRSRAR